MKAVYRLFPAFLGERANLDLRDMDEILDKGSAPLSLQVRTEAATATTKRPNTLVRHVGRSAAR
jgi:hypothetical protein